MAELVPDAADQLAFTLGRLGNIDTLEHRFGKPALSRNFAESNLQNPLVVLLGEGGRNHGCIEHFAIDPVLHMGE
ncbi:hypothetical protein D3C80_1471190 [compost metagenome]